MSRGPADPGGRRSVETRRGYVDSVTLMQVSARVGGLDGVDAALVAMGTDLNLELAAELGFTVPAGVGPQDLLVALAAESAAALAAARVEVDRALAAARPGPAPAGLGAAPPPRTVAAAARGLDPAGTVALVSTPGAWAFADALDAVEAGLHTMVFSDNVPVEQEVLLKERAAAAGVLLMGPDCGTAVLGGVGLGFANVVRPGPVGLVAASGTGAQHLMCLLDAAGVGVSHCLGVGGRDLSGPVAARSTLAALQLLDADPATELVVVLSKPPDPAVAARVAEQAAAVRTPTLLGLLGPGRPDLTALARAVAERLGRPWAAPEHWSGALRAARAGGHLRGLYAGGTLCHEAMLVAAEVLGPVPSNVPLPGAPRVDPGAAQPGHALLDLGDDELTRGRPHPMIDPGPRAERLRAAAEDPTAGVVLLDVVLGHAAHPDPAGALEEPVRRATAAGLPVVACVVGARDDPQDLRGQCAMLTEAGAAVHLSNAAATRAALDLLAAS